MGRTVNSASADRSRRVGPYESRPTEVMKPRPQRVARQLEGRQRNRQGEPARAGTSRIEVEDAANRLDLRPMRMPRDDHVDPRRCGIKIQFVDVVKHIN